MSINCGTRVILATGILSRWFGWTAVVAGVLCILSPLGGNDAPPAILLFLAWVLAVSVALLLPRRGRAKIVAA